MSVRVVLLISKIVRVFYVVRKKRGVIVDGARF